MTISTFLSLHGSMDLIWIVIVLLVTRQKRRQKGL